MKKKRFALSVVLFLLSLALLFAPAGTSSLKQGSLSFFDALFQSQRARAVFDLEEEEALQVFGWKEGAYYL
ncbi:MAG: hypothetical protein IKJ74_07060 [Clostridia bacterium]|nr:hypothetical protein [Clostridia bacterium]